MTREPEIDVPMGGVTVAASPGVLRTNLGSCVGVALYDPQMKWGGLAHVVMPESVKELGKVSTSYADVGIRDLLDQLKAKGCKKERLSCAIGGGGCMFKGASEVMDIGKRNIEAVRNLLSAENVLIVSEKVGGPFSTVMFLDLSDGQVRFDRREANLAVVIRKEVNYRRQWVNQNADHTTKLESLLREKRSDYVDPVTKKVDAKKLLSMIRMYSAMNKFSRLIGYVVFQKMLTECSGE